MDGRGPAEQINEEREPGGTGVRVKAQVTSHDLDYKISGQLTEKFEVDSATGYVVGSIPVLHLMAVGRTEDETRDLLGRTFVEFCEVEIERDRFWPTLTKRGFVVIEAAQSSKLGPLAQYLFIDEEPIEQTAHSSKNTYVAGEAGEHAVGGVLAEV